MVAIFTGLGAGLARGSGNVIGSGGVMGSGATGRAGEGLSVNAATGNLVINRQDEFLTGPGLDVGLSRTYNSLAEASDGDNNDKWQLSSARRVFGLQGSVNTAGSSIRRLASDGSVSTYLYETRNGVTAYWTTDGAGAHDKLTVSGSQAVWTDGDTQVTETYDADPYASGQWRLVAQTDTTGQALSITYSGNRLLRITTNSGEYMEYGWSGNQLAHVSLYTANPATGGLVQSVRTRYGYDGAGRLNAVLTDLTPEDSSIGDNRYYAVYYSYDASGRLGTLSQSDGSRTDIAYDAAGRVASLTETVGDGTSRVTSLAYGHDFTNVTAPDGQVTQLKFSSGGNVVNSLVDWGYGGVSREPAEAIGGEHAFKFTSSPGADWSGIAAGFNAATGETFKFTLSLQAVPGHANDQSLGVYGNTTGWGDAFLSHARIVSGPGQLERWGSSGFWRVTGLSTTEATKIEIIRSFDRAEGAGAYFYVDHPNGYRDGQQVIAAGAMVEKLSEEVVTNLDITNWHLGGTTTQATTWLNGYKALQLASAPGADWSAAYTGFGARQGETVRVNFLMQAVSGHETSQGIGIYGNTTGWYDNRFSHARIVSGPGSLRQGQGGLWYVDGLSASQATEIEITRTFDREESGGVYAYVDLLGGFRDGQQVYYATKSITKLVDWHHAEKQLSHIVAPPAFAGAAQQVQQFLYDRDGNLTRTISPTGQATTFSYDEMGNVTLIDRPLGTDVRRWYDGKNHLVLEESYGSNENYDHVSHYNAYAYDGTGRLRYAVTPDGKVTEYRYDGYGRVLEEVVYRGQTFPYATVWIDEGMMNSWRDGLGDKTLRNITSHRYDGRGNLAYSYEWSTTDSAGNYSSSHGYILTYYSYDANGRLLAKYRNGEVGETFVYDGLDRVVGSSSGASGVTTIFFDDVNSRTVMHLSSGLTKTLTYNKAGDLISEVSSAPGANHTSATDLNASWGYGGVVRDNATSTTGAAAYRYYSPNGDAWRGVYSGYNVAAGDTVRVRMSVRSDGTTSTHSFGLYSNQDAWGSNGDGQSQAIIVSGPGVLRQTVGGLYWIEGLSTTVETTVEIVRTYSQAASGGAYFYVGGHGSAPAGTGVILSAPSVTIARADGVAAISTETRNSYDKLGRLRVSLDNFDNGNRSYFVYDKAGRLTGQLDDYGALTEYKYDASNRLIQTSRYMNGVDANAFAQLTNPDNTVTIDQLRPAAESRDIHMWTVYDANDRVVQTIDGTGAVTAFEYDGKGRAVRTTVYANRVSVAGWAASPPLSPVGVSANASVDAVTRTFYDRQGQVRGVLDGEGYLTENVYDAAGRLIETIAYAQQVPAVYRASYGFGDIRANAAPYSGDNRRTRYIYDGADQLRFTVDAQNRVTQYDYDSAGQNYRVVERVLPISVGNWDFLTVYNAVAGHGDDRISYKYADRTGRTVRTTDATGLNTYFWYDQAGHVVQTQVGDGSTARTTRNWYDARGALRFTIDAENYLTRYSYSTGGRLIQTTRFDNQASVGSGASIQDVNAQTAGGAIYTSIHYDNVGRVVREYNGNQEYTQYAYTRLGQVEQIYTGRTDATWTDQSYTHQFYDAAGRNYATYAALGEAEWADSWRYHDARGNVWRTDDARGRQSYAEYDRRGMLVATTDANGGVVRYAYNAFGEITSVTDARGYTTTSQYDNLGQLSRTIDAAGTHTVYGYTRFGELLTVTKAGATTTFGYDRMGRVTSSTDALGGVERYSYDAYGDRTQMVNRLGGVTTYTYDKLGRLRYEWVDTVAYNEGGGVTANGFYKTILEYDSRGNVTRKLEGYPLPEQKITHYAYDRANRLTQEIATGPHGQSPTTQYRYDARGNLTSKVAPDGGRTVYYYDDLDRVTVEISPVGTFTSYGYDQNGNVTRIRVFETVAAVPGDGGAEEEQPAAPGSSYRETVFGYDALNRMVNSVVNNVQGRVFNGSSYVSQGWGLETRYEYDANGNVIRTWDPNGNTTYAYYDALGRKWSQVDAAGYRTDWTYDANGNVTREWRYSTAATPTGTGSPPGVGQNVYVDRITDYQYDTLGRRTVEQRLYVLMHDGNGNQYYGHPYVSYQYNALSQVVRKTEATGEWVNYEYDSSGRLMREYKSGYTDFGGAAVSPRIEYRYDSVGNLTRTTMAGNGNVADRVTTYGYDGGKLRWVADAEANDGDGRDGKITYYWYDIAGNVNFEYYTRYNSAGGYADGSIYDARRRSYDALGRVTQEWASRHLSDGWNDIGPVSTTTYNTFGEVASVSTGGGATRYNQYDAAGRLIGTNGDGSWKYFSYDKNGNQTAMVESAGGDIAWQGFDWSLGQAYRADVNASYTTYDARNMAVAIYEEGRDLSEGVSGQMLVTSRLYNAFGEVAREVSAAGAQIDYTYNTMGKVVTIENPTVSVQYENGSTANVRPTEHFYYDQSGRLVGQRDANGNLTRMHLLAGTGYNGGKALVTHEIHADGGIIYNYYDAQGDARVTMNEVGRTFAMAYDQMGRLVQKTDNGSGLSDYFTYDGLGHQLTHWNTHYGSGNMEVTDYDYAGRVTSQRAFGGDTTTTTYAWYGHLGGFGGWEEINYFANGRNQITDTDIFGKVLWRRDQGYHAYSYYYDNAGRLSSMTQNGTSARQDYTYYNTGKLKTITVLAYESGSDYNSQTTLYGYDRAGNVVLQRTTEQGQETYYYGYYDYYEPEYYTNSWSRQTQNITAGYDALGRMVSWAEHGSTGAPAASATYSYDAAGNIRRVSANYRPIDQQGNDAGYAASQEDWYRYDSMNRVVISHGQLSNGVISRGWRGKEIYYNAAGQRTQVWTTTSGSYSYWVSGGYEDYYYQEPYYGGPGYGYNQGYQNTVYYTADVREDYQYDGGGRVYQVLRAESGFDGYGYEMEEQWNGYADPQAYVYAPGAGETRGVFSYDAMGRLVGQTDYSGGAMVYSRAVTFDAAGRVYVDDSTTRRGSDLLRSYSVSYYAAGESAAYAVVTTNWKNGSTSGAPGTRLDNTFAYFDGAVQSQVRYDSNTGSGSNAIFTSSYRYDAFGRLTSASVNDGRPRTVTYTNDVNGQVIRRDEADNNYSNGDPHEIYYRLAGKQLGAVGNNGTDNVDYKASNDQRSQTPGTGAFRGGQTYGAGFAEFGNDYDAINSYSQGSSGGLYTVRSGDTLQGIAMQLWGDAGLWYKLAEANGLGAGSALAEGRTLAIPTGVQRVHNNANTMKPYDPAEALGDTSPTTPEPAKPKKNKCGVFGMILLAVVAVAVAFVVGPAIIGVAANAAAGTAATGLTAILGGAGAAAGSAAAIGAGVIGGAIAGAAGSIASQALGVATGIQDKFSWKAVGLAAIGGGVGGGLNASGLFGSVTDGAFKAGSLGIKNGIIDAGLRGIATSALTQGLGVATGLQEKFSWSGVAAAGVSAAVSFGVGGKLPALDADNTIGNHLNHLGTAAASLMANAAARSAIEGSSFGDNVMSAIPDVIGQAIFGALRHGVKLPTQQLTDDPKDNVSAVIAPAENLLDSPDFQAALPALNAQGIQIVGEGPTRRISVPQGVTSVEGTDSDGAAFIFRVDPIVPLGGNQYRISTGAVTMDGTPRGTDDGDIYILSSGGAPTSISFGRAKDFATRAIFNSNGGVLYSYIGNVYSSVVGLNIAYGSENPFSATSVASSSSGASSTGEHGLTIGSALNTTAEVLVPGYYASNRGGEAFRSGNYWAALGWYALGAGEVGLTVATFGGSSVVMAGVRGGVRGGILVSERLAVSGTARLEAEGVDLALRFKSGWSEAQRVQAVAKTRALTEADTIVLQTERGSTSAASRYRRAGNSVSAGNDVDHIHDLQLGGADILANMQQLDRSVNRSLGAQIQRQIRNLPEGTRINRVTIGD